MQAGRSLIQEEAAVAPAGWTWLMACSPMAVIVRPGLTAKLALIIDPSHITGAGASIGDKLGTGLKKLFGK